MTCSILDITCNINAFISWLWSYIQPLWDLLNNIITFIISLGVLIITFITNIFSLAWAFITLFFSILSPFFVSGYALLTFGVIASCIFFALFRYFYNIIADMEVFGFKLPKL